MTIRNRELSQFGSFVYIDNNTKDIGITTELTPYVGIGTTNAQAKFHVVGDSIFDGDVSFLSNIENINVGIITATEIYLNGNLLIDAELQSWVFSGSDIYRNIGNVGIGTSTNLYKLSVNGQIESQAPQGTAPFVIRSTSRVPNLNASFLNGKSAPAGDIVGTTDNQSLTGKTINLSSNTLTGTLSQFNTALSGADFASITGTETLTNKTLTTPVISSISNNGTQTIPTGNGTLISTNSVGIITRGMIGDLDLVDSDISNTAAIKFSKISTVGIGNSIENDNIANSTIQNIKLVNSTISGISLGSNLKSLIPGNYLSGDSYNGSVERTWDISATSSSVPDTLVSRDSNGDFSAGSITATDFESTSDINLKHNIKKIDNALETINQLRGVSFDWKETNKKSYGVIAQELQKIIPNLVKDGNIKSVNYNGLIGILIEAIKELSEEVEELKKKII